MKYLIPILCSCLLFILYSCGDLTTPPNDAPTLTAASFSVAENSAVDTAVGTLSATDANDDPITFTLTDTSNTFTINASSGAITVAGSLNFETTPSYALVATATDDEGLSSTASVTITVTEVDETVGNTSPTITASTFTIAENSAAGTAVGTLGATDANDDPITFTLTDTSNTFTINASSGAITVAGSLDFETTPSYALVATATDDEGLSGTASVTITVTNVDETVGNTSPTITASTFTIAENSAAGTAVGTLSATDTDQDTLTYSILETQTVFALNTSSGQITVANAIDFETTASYTLTASVTDSKSAAVTESITITVTNVNEAPVVGNFSILVGEGEAIGFTVMTFTVSDPDASDTHTFTITAGNDAGHFAISSAGVLTTAATLDFDTTENYELTVTATDAGGLTDTSTLSITVLDIPAVPTGVTASVGHLKISLSWSESSAANSYKIYRKITGQADSEYAEINTSSTTAFSDTTVESPTTYHYKISAVSQAGESEKSVADVSATSANGEEVQTAWCVNCHQTPLLNAAGAKDNAGWLTTYNNMIAKNDWNTIHVGLTPEEYERDALIDYLDISDD